MRYTKKLICSLEEVLKQNEIIDQVHTLVDKVGHFLNDMQNPSFSEKSPLLDSFGTFDIEQRLTMCWSGSWKALEHNDKNYVDVEVLRAVKLLQDYIIITETSI